MRGATEEELPAAKLAWLVIAPFFFGYFVSYLFRAVNAVVEIGRASCRERV